MPTIDRQPMRERVISAMKELGFTATDAKAYLCLVERSPATGYEVAARSDVPRSAIYGVLRRLESLGLVNAIDEDPARWVPLAPARLVELLEARSARRLAELGSALERMRPAAPDAVTWTLHGYEPLIARTERLVAQAERSVYASLWAREAERLAPALAGAKARGVDVILFSFNPLPAALGAGLSYGISESDLEAYWPHKLIVVVDATRCLVGGAEPSPGNRAIVTDEPALVEMAISNLVLDITLLGQRRGIDTEAVVSQLTRLLAPIERLATA
jgi:DNA-binding transcriptional ArsR family regulator